jgi:hypothetical protein
MPGILEAAGQGVRRSFEDIGESAEAIAGKRPADTGSTSPAAAPFEWSDIGHPLASGLPKLAYRFGESSPTTAAGIAGGLGGEAVAGPVGGIVGGGLGAATGSAVQTLGPAFGAELKRTPNDPNGAWDRAMQQAGASGAFSGIGWSLFPLKFWSGPVKNTLFQVFGVQPALSAGHQITSNVIEGEPALQNVPGAAGEGVVGAAVPALGQAAVRGAGRLTGRAPATPPTQDLGQIAQDYKASGSQKIVAARSSGMTFSPALGQDIANKAIAALQDPAVNIPRRLQPEVYKALDSLTTSGMGSAMSGQPTLTVGDLHVTRQLLDNLGQSTKGQTRAAAFIAKGALDDAMRDPNLLAQHALTNANQAPQVARTFQEGLDEYARGALASEMERQGIKAEDAANYVNSLSAYFRKSLNDPRTANRLKTFTDPSTGLTAYDTMRNFVRGEPGAFSQFLQMVGKASPENSVAAALEMIEALHHPIGFVAPAVGYVAKHWGEALSPRSEVGGKRALTSAQRAVLGVQAPPQPPRPWRPQTGAGPAYLPGPLPGMPPSVQQQQQNRGGAITHAEKGAMNRALKHAVRAQRHGR